jgi:hypothetical protein
MGKLTYDVIKETFRTKDCKLLTSEEEFISKKLNGLSKYKLLASCGHEVNNCWFHMFKYRSTGVICKICVDSNQSKHQIELNKNFDGNCYALNIEFQSIQLLKKYIDTSILEIKISPECCSADLCIKDINCIDDKWLPIQLKSTIKQRHNIYSFGLLRNYHNTLIIFICIEEEKFWFINGNNLLDQCKLSIGVKRSKYSVYEVDKINVTQKILEFYKTMDKDTLENIQTPITENYRREQVFRKLRETKLNGIKFVLPQINQSVFDFKINDYKIQEKTAFMKTNRNYMIVMFTKNKNGVNNVPYDQGDNDFYWVNLPDYETFYIIPEKVLINKKIISTDTVKGKKYLSFAITNKWVDNYRYYYDEYNINKIINFYFDKK